MRKPVFGVSDQVRQKPGFKTTQDGKRFEIRDLGSRGIVRRLLFKFVDFLYSRLAVLDRVLNIISLENIFFCLSFDV